jgi:nicotinamidase/pyrazinamidase
MKALIIVDLQNDFLPGGMLAVPKGDEIVPIINQLQQKFELIVVTQDWHPKEHGSFADVHDKKPGETILLHKIKQTLWPRHCIQGSSGAAFFAGLDMSRVSKIIRKGSNKQVDSYSCFFDNDHKSSTGLEIFLKKNKATDVFIAGLATDYCVKYSVLDACRLGFNTFVIKDAVRGIDLNPGDIEKALKEMKNAGAKTIESSVIVRK